VARLLDKAQPLVMTPTRLNFSHMFEPTGLAKVLILAAFLAWFISLLAVPVVRSLAHRVGLVDRPDPTRKLHRGNIALGGGFAVFVATLLAIVLLDRFVIPQLLTHPLEWNERWVALALASAAIVALGLVDDRFELRGKQKLVGQIAIVYFLAMFWQPSGDVLLFGFTFDLAVFTIPLLMIWLLACINAVNLIDGADGVAGSFAAIASLGIALVAFVYGNSAVAVGATAVGFSIAGFLCFNRPPASIFLGDAGSMAIGLVLGSLACWAVEKPVLGGQDMLIPITLMGVPLFDSVAAILRRVLTGRSIYMGDRGHLHHIIGAHLKQRDLSPTWMLIAFGSLTAITASGAIVGAVFKSDVLAVLVIGFVVAGLIWSRIFGHAEARLLASHTRRVGGSLVSRVRRDNQKAHVSGVPLQGNRQWDGVWLPLVEFAERNGLWQMKLDLSMPWQHEGYHGYWSRGRLPEKNDQWSVRLPIICQRRSVGRLEIIGQAEGESQLESLEAFSFLISEMQPAIEGLVCSLDDAHGAEAARTPAIAKLVATDSSKQFFKSTDSGTKIRVAAET
jgi:UDP-GlcNAc:undecaprenyl-phosphate GlcNAc-1-phosphate transferase